MKRPATGRVLRKTLKLRSDRLYRLRIWARSDRRNRLTVWVKSGDRKVVIGNWSRVPRKWRRYRVHFTVDQDGPAVLGIVAPSSHKGPAGRMWIDDIAVFERPLWPQNEISGGVGFNDYPVMAAAGDDSAWTAWISFRDGRDTLQTARLGLRNGRVEPESAREIDTRGTTGILYPALVAGEDGDAWLLYAAEQDGNWDIRAVHLARDGPREPVQVTRHPAVDIRPAAVVHDGRLWVAWESNRDGGERHVYLAAVQGAKAGEPIRVSTAGSNNYAPALDVESSGALWTVWHSFRENNFDLYARALEGANQGSERRLTQAPCIDRNVRMANRDGKLWLAWELACYEGYKLGRATRKRVRLARFLNGHLEPPRKLKKTQLWRNAQSPNLAFDAKGHLWITARVPRDSNSGWDVMTWRYAGKRWDGPWLPSRRKGRSSSPQVASVGKLIVICYQGDDVPRRWFSVGESDQASSGVYAAAIRPSFVPSRPTLSSPEDEPRERFEAAALRLRRGDDRRGWTVEHGGKRLQLYFGDLHEHSDISACDRVRDETPEQTFQMMRDIVGADFGAITDHGKNLNRYLWHHLGKVTRANQDPGRFLTLRGQEWTSSFETTTRDHPHGYHGHRNLIVADPFFPRWFNAEDGMRPAELTAELVKSGAGFVLIPHQLADTDNVPVDWSGHDERHQPVAEIFQGRGSYECRGCPRQAAKATRRGHYLQDVWAGGTVVGVIASPDHYGGLGKAGVYATGLEAGSVMESLKARRTYGTTGAKILLDVRVNGHFMGEIGPPPGDQPVRIEVRVDCPSPIRAVEISRNNEFIFRAEVEGRRCQLAFDDVEPGQAGSHYYVRVTQRDGEMAWSSPVWLGRSGT